MESVNYEGIKGAIKAIIEKVERQGQQREAQKELKGFRNALELSLSKPVATDLYEEARGELRRERQAREVR